MNQFLTWEEWWEDHPELHYCLDTEAVSLAAWEARDAETQALWNTLERISAELHSILWPPHPKETT